VVEVVELDLELVVVQEVIEHQDMVQVHYKDQHKN
jgi:hypothetical protein|tara:strand:- start:548 stop:652 length:105 start_codon:yes stop_codon:yes gene_type:complete